MYSLITSVSPLYVATELGHLDIVKYFIEDEECDPYTAVKGERVSLLHVATHRGHTALVKYLMDSYSKMYSLNPSKLPLYFATGLGHLDIVKFFLEEKMCDPYTAVSDNRVSLLHVAAWQGRIELVKYLMGSYSDMYLLKPSELPLFVATYSGHLNVVKCFIEEKNCDPCALMGGDIAASLVHVVHVAASGGHTKVVRYFVEEVNPPVDYMKPDKQGHCPLHYAASRGHIETFNYFITELQCDINTPTASGLRPIHLAARDGHLNLVEFLLEQPNCDIIGYDKRGFGPLHLAAFTGHVDIVQRS